MGKIERLKVWVAWKLPRWLVHWCVIRLMAHATTQVYPDRTPDSITIWEYLKAWDVAA